jgi:hypothetical protein
LFVGIVPSKASAREANLAAAFFEARLRFFVLQHARSVFAFDCAPARGTPIPKAHTALAIATATHRCRIFFIFISRSRQTRSAKV